MAAHSKNKPRPPRENLTHAQLLSLLHYDPETGVWRKRSNKPQSEWRQVGHIGGRNYTVITVFRVAYLSHRLAWFYVYGKWPEHEIDHINHDTYDNRMCNLREATSHQNMCNATATRKQALPRGVVRTSKSRTFTAQIKIDGRKKHLGTFETADDASEFYELAAEMIHGEFAYHIGARVAQEKLA